MDRLEEEELSQSAYNINPILNQEKHVSTRLFGISKGALISKFKGNREVTAAIRVIIKGPRILSPYEYKDI